jgi:hypothetical protein
MWRMRLFRYETAPSVRRRQNPGCDVVVASLLCVMNLINARALFQLAAVAYIPRSYATSPTFVYCMQQSTLEQGTERHP